MSVEGGKDRPKDGAEPSTSKFNYASAIFRSIKRQKLDVTESESKSDKESQKSQEEPTKEGSSQESIPDVTTYEVDELREQAIQKLKQEAARNAERAKTMGPRGWMKPTLTVNKQFLGRMVHSTRKRSSDGKPKNSR